MVGPSPPLSSNDGSDSGLCIGGKRRYDEGARFCVSDAVSTTLVVVLLLVGMAFCAWYLFVPHGVKRRYRRRRKP